MPAAIASRGEAKRTAAPPTCSVPAVDRSTPNSTRATSVRPLPTRPPRPTISPARSVSEISAKAPSRDKPAASSSTGPAWWVRGGYNAESGRPTISAIARSRGSPDAGSTPTRRPSRSTATRSARR